jgi:hypothetical protein
MAMKQQQKKPEGALSNCDDKFDLDSLLHPAKGFGHPMKVVRDPDLSLNEKRAILASWASDACALEAAPELRVNPNGGVVQWDDIMDALRLLDKEMETGGVPRTTGRWRRRLGWRQRTGGGSDHGPQLN